MDRDELFIRLAETIAGDAALVLDGWRHLALVSVIDAGTPDMTGFCYLTDGRAVPVAPTDFGVFDVLEDLRTAMADADGSAPWVAALFRVDAASGSMRAEYEYADAARLAVTPQNVAARACELAPG